MNITQQKIGFYSNISPIERAIFCLSTIEFYGTKLCVKSLEHLTHRSDNSTMHHERLFPYLHIGDPSDPLRNTAFDNANDLEFLSSAQRTYDFCVDAFLDHSAGYFSLFVCG